MRRHGSSVRETLSVLNAKDMLNASRWGKIVVEERLAVLEVVSQCAVLSG